MVWDAIAGHASVKKNLISAVKSGRLNHAYLFSGPSGVGKFLVAKAFAASILCPDGGCGTCDVCRRIFEEKHPDVTIIRPAGKNIPVDTIRKVRLNAYRRPLEGVKTIFIFKNAERMWEEGASTLLKILEEPPKNVIFILVTSNPSSILPTIRSRCMEVKFSMVPRKEVEASLVKVKKVSGEEAELIARLTGGVLGRAYTWCDEPWRLARREMVIKCARFLRRARVEDILEYARKITDEIGKSVVAVGELYGERKREIDNGTLDDGSRRMVLRELEEEGRREQSKEETRSLKEILETFEWWYRDILIFEEGVDMSLIVNVDYADEIRDEAAVLTPERLVACIEVIEESMRMAEQNVPVLLNLESTLLKIKEVLYA